MNNDLDRFGLLVIGIFLGGVIEAIGIERLSIVISVALLVVIVFLDKTFLKDDANEVEDE
jgi:hypothetical protein